MQDGWHLVGDPACLVIVFFGTPDGQRDVFRSRNHCHSCDMGKPMLSTLDRELTNVSVAAFLTQEIALRCILPVFLNGETYLWYSWSLFNFHPLANDFKNYRNMSSALLHTVGKRHGFSDRSMSVTAAPIFESAVMSVTRLCS